MSSDEDFSLVVEPSLETLDGVRLQIQKQKDKYTQLIQDQQDLTQGLAEAHSLIQKVQDRAQGLQRDLDEDRERSRDRAAQDQERLRILQQEEQELRKEVQRVLAELHQVEATTENLREQADVFSGAPERLVVFRGLTGRPKDGPCFDMEPLVEYPMDGGTALITFEEEAVAKQVLSKRRHKVDLGGEFHMMVEARPVPITLPSSVQVSAQVCPRRVLVSNLPQMDRQTLEDKLDVHFSKSKHGGGEVDECTLLAESGNAVISFIQDNVAKRLTDAEFHDLKLSEGTSRVRVTPFVNGTITDLQIRTKLCQRTVLLTGIPDIADAETLQDLLEIHFQKKVNGGGEIEAVLYCPAGQSRTALFQTPRKDE